MDFFKSVFSDEQEQDQEQSDLEKNQGSAPSTSPKEATDENLEQETPLMNTDSHSDSTPKSSGDGGDGSGGGAWSFGGLIKTFQTKSESVIQTYRRDLEEFSTGLKKETEAIREAASRAVKELPVSIEVGASVAQGSLKSVGHVIDEFGSSVLRGTTDIITHGKDALLSGDLDNNDSIDNSQHFRNSKRYSRFEANVIAIQNDVNTYCEEPDDLGEFEKWKLGFDLEEKVDEIENSLDENEVMEGLYTKLVPNSFDEETFWVRYFYRVYKLKQAEEARAKLVKRVISTEEEDLSWDVDDDESNVEEEESKGESPRVEELQSKERVEPEVEKKPVEVVPEMEKKDVEVVPEMEKKAVEVVTEIEKKPVEVVQVERSSSEDVERKVDDKEVVAETSNGSASDKKIISRESGSDQKIISNESGSDKKIVLEEKEDPSESKSNNPVTETSEKVSVEGKSDHGESGKDSDFSVVSSQPSLPEEEEDLGWDEIEDLGSHDEKKVTRGSPNRADLRKRLSAAEEDEDLSWDIEDEDEPVKH